MAFRLFTTAFKNDGPIPMNFTAEGANTSPPFQWEGSPPETQSFALICLDPDAPSGAFCHWLVYDIPANVTELDPKLAHEDLFPNEMKQGVNDAEQIGYTGAYPPPGRAHHYVFRLYALKHPPGLNIGMRKDELLAKLNEMGVLAIAEYTGVYKSFKKAKKAA